jgi:alanyl-tRNA synthetase
LYDTYGFPIDLTSLIAKENGLSIDEEEFNNELQIQKDRSRAATAVETDDWVQINPDVTTEFIGYDHTSSEVEIIKYRKVSQKGKEFFQIVLNQTPFYPEGGGQVGDKGSLNNNEAVISIFDTKKENNLIIHLTDKLPGNLNGKFEAQVNTVKRDLTSFNHSATHLLHFALRKVLGTHVEQKGSLVNTDYLRFDFSHFSKVSNEEIARIETIVGEAIHANISLNEKRAVPIEEAKAMGAMALFGEKYGEHVRVIQFGESVELCGGIHVSSTGKIGLFKITSESAVAAGVRRIEAITGPTAEKFFRDKAEKLDEIAILLKNPKDLSKAIEDLISKNHQLNKEVEHLLREKAKGLKSELKSKIHQIGSINFLGEIIQLDSNSIKDLLFQMKNETKNFIGIIGHTENDKCGLSLIISENLVQERNLNAAQIIREISTHIQGGGGGQAFFATAGGKKKDGLKDAIMLFESKLDCPIN